MRAGGTGLTVIVVLVPHHERSENIFGHEDENDAGDKPEDRVELRPFLPGEVGMAVVEKVYRAFGLPLDEKLRQAYFWIVNTAIISPHYDVEYNEEPPPSLHAACPELPEQIDDVLRMMAEFPAAATA